MFRGRAVHTIDAKGRLSIPAGFRMELQRNSDHVPILTNQPQCLALYPLEAWEAIETELDGGSSLQQEAQALQRFLISAAESCPVDKQGRVLIPPYQREHAGLEREVIVAGVGPRIEIWDKARFEQDLAETRARYAEYTTVLAESRRSRE